jgi:hypothetical protein
MEFALTSAWQSESDREVVHDTRAPHGRSWPGFTPSHTLCASAVHKGGPVPSARQECCVESWIAARGVDVAWDGYELLLCEGGMSNSLDAWIRQCSVSPVRCEPELQLALCL